jgi:hypothetical protein
VAQLGSAFGWGPKGRRFKSGRPDYLSVSVRSRQIPPTPLHHAVRMIICTPTMVIMIVA